MQKSLSHPFFSTTRGWWAILRYTAIILFFALLSIAYFSPALLDAWTLYRLDVEAVSGNGIDAKLYNEDNPDDPSYWTNSLFGGMPMYQIAPSYPSLKGILFLESLYRLGGSEGFFGPYAWLLFILMVGFFIFLKSLRVGDLLSVVGALMWAFSSYFVILIGAGHIWKLITLAYIPPTIAGMVLIYQRKLLLGAFVLALFTALQLMGNHLQMTYYFLFVMLAFFIGWLVEAIRLGEYKRFFEATGVALLAGGIGIAINGTNLYHTYSYSKETMRGGSELATLGEQEGKTKVASKGLEKDYITQWSYGIGESFSLIVPNIRGGSSTTPLGKHTSHIKKVPAYLQQNVVRMGSYWGDQPFTSGPVYVGVFVVMLFLLGAMVVKGPIKWVLLLTTLLSLLLSWGKNFMPLTDFFIDYVPLYNKFRSVSSILVIAEFTIPTLAILGLLTLIKDPNLVKKNRHIPLIAFGIPLLLLLVMALFPTLFGNFLSPYESQQLGQLALSEPIYLEFMDSLRTVRASMLSSDAWRSIVIVILSLGVLFLFIRKRLNATAMVLLIGFISVVDLWSVCKRYLHDDMFKTQPVHQIEQPSVADLEILQDKEPTFRVLNLTVDPFNDASTSRFHRSVGGYHAAKLQRYQDLIDYYLRDLHPEVLNMLNTRYFIVKDFETQRVTAQRNPDAYGSAWFASEVKIVNNAHEELAALGKADLRKEAIVDKRYLTDRLKDLRPFNPDAGRLDLLHFSPKEMTYQVTTPQACLAIFSQVYYPHGWKATIKQGEQAEELPIIRANYILRGVVLPKGDYQLNLRFEPTSITITESIAKGAFVLLLLLGVATIVYYLRKTRCRTETSKTSSTPS